MNTLAIPEFALVVLIGPSAERRSVFAGENFRDPEVLSLEACQRQAAATGPAEDAPARALDLLEGVVRERLQARRLAVVDAANLHAAERSRWVHVARSHHALPVAVVLDQPAPFEGLRREGFRRIHRLPLPEDVDNAAVYRYRLPMDRRLDLGPFDIIGDVHGCADELETLLERLGYRVESGADGVLGYRVTPPAGRKAVFVGDLVDRGPGITAVLRLVMSMMAAGHALCVMGNHDDKLLRWLDGRKVKVSHGLEASIEQLEREPAELRDRVHRFLAHLTDHLWLDQGRLCVAHAGLDESRIGRTSGAVRAFALYGDTTGERDEYGLPVRLDWAARYAGETLVVYGHTPVVEPVWRNNTLCLDTGCVFGGALTALRYPENEVVTVPAREVYFESLRPFQRVNALP